MITALKMIFDIFEGTISAKTQIYWRLVHQCRKKSRRQLIARYWELFIHRLDPQTFDQNLSYSIDNDLVVNGDVEKHLQGAAACISRW